MLMCGVGAKSVAHLMKFYLLQWEVMKVKFLINSNMTLTVLNLHQKTDPKVQQDSSINFLYLTVSKIYPRQDFIGQGHYGKVKSRSNQGQTMMLHTYTPNQCLHQISTSYSLQFPRYSPDKIL